MGTLFEVKAGEYELIELNTKSKHVYTHLDNDRLSEGLHEALGRYHASGSVCEEDRRLAGEVLRGYASLRAETDVMRCKLCALLLPTYSCRAMRRLSFACTTRCAAYCLS